MSAVATGVLTDRAPKPAGHYTQAVVSRGHVYISGQLPIRPDGRPPDAYPVRSVVPVPELHHGHLVEIDAIAVQP